MRQLPIIVPVLFLLSLATVVAYAEPKNDIKLIIDVSGSMQKNDPDNLRRPAVNLLMSLLPEDAFASVWLFGDKLEPLVPYGPVTPAFKSNAISSSQLIHSSGLLTDIGGGLEAAMLGANPGGKAILLSDGMVDLGSDSVINMAEQARIQHRLIPRLQASNAEIHTVALSDNADKEILEAISIGTGGLFEVAKSADDLTRIFLRLFDDVVIQDRLPIEEGRFLVDSSVEEFTLLAFQSKDSAAIQIRSPDDIYYLAKAHPKEVRWYQDAGFDLITIVGPAEGEWRLFSDEDPQNRVTVLSDLKLDVTNLANVIHEASFPTLEVRFLQGAEVITDLNFLNLMDLQLIILTPSGKRIARTLTDFVDGVFTSELGFFAEPGRYEVNVNVDGKSFRREVVQEIEYGDPARIVFSDQERLVSVRPLAIGLLGENLRMILRLEDDQNKKRLLPMQSDGDLWQVHLTDVPYGTYELTVHVKGQAITGQAIDFRLKPQMIDLTEVIGVDSALVATAKSWGVRHWGIAIGVGLVNLVFIILIIWFIRRRKKNADQPEIDAEVAELLNLAPEAPASSDQATSDRDIIATLAEAEALREEEKHAVPTEEAKLEAESKSEAKSQTNQTPEPPSGSENIDREDLASSEPEVGEISDIVDAWGDAEETTDPGADRDLSAAENEAPVDEDQANKPDELDATVSRLDENAETRVLDEPPKPSQDAASSG